MIKAVLALLAVFGVLFALTTFPQSPQAREKALQEKFTEQEIEDGYRLSVQLKLISWAGIFLELGFLLAIAGTGRARWFADRFDRWSGARWWLALLYMGGFCFLALSLLSLPLAIIRLEVLQTWGMSHQALVDWLGDYGKRIGLSAGIGALVLIGWYALMRWLPRLWWAAAAALGSVLAVAFAWLLPIWIDPLFHTFTPLSQYTNPKIKVTDLQQLQTSIPKLAAGAGVPVQEVLVMDASRQGSHTNAYFTGFGATRRIVLYDTLLENHTPAEIEVILAHEIGHWQHRHIAIGLTLGSVALLIGLYLLSCVLRWAINRRPFMLHSPADPAGLPLILLLAFAGSLLTQPVENAISRHFERQADWTALELTRQPEVFIAAERQLARDNKSNLVPNPLAVFWFATHPPAWERIDMAREWEQKHSSVLGP
jgi:STE24 endopeptidase